MKLRTFLLFLTMFILMSLRAPTVWSGVILTIENKDIFANTEENLIHFSMDNPDDEVSALQADIHFATECFTVTDVIKTARSEHIDIFGYSYIPGGIRIAMTGIGHLIDPGTGPIADIMVTALDCYGDYMWEIASAVVAAESVEPLSCLEGVISLESCEPWIDISFNNIEFGSVPLGQAAVKTLFINLSGCGWPVDFLLEPDGCADAFPRSFTIESDTTKKVTIFCRPEEKGPCEGSIHMMYSASGPEEITVSCNGFIPVGTKGDVNEDGAIDVRDAILCINHILGFWPIEDPNRNWAADCNGPPGNCDGDGFIDVFDAIKIVNLILDFDECLGENVIYFNSFESDEDTAGWHFIPEMFVNDPAPKCGTKSLYIGGGCLQPTAWLTLPFRPNDGHYSIGCWGKIDTTYYVGAGGIVLTTSEPVGERPEIDIIVETEDWIYYESEDSLFCTSNNSLRIEIYCGGYIPVYMLIDCLKVEQIE